jgi:hypothetical protein
MIFFDRFSSSTAFSIWQPKNAPQTLGDKLVCISNLQHYAAKDRWPTGDGRSYMAKAKLLDN